MARDQKVDTEQANEATKPKGETNKQKNGPEQARRPKIGAGHLSAMGRLGLREVRNAVTLSRESVADSEMGLYGTRTPGEVAEIRSDSTAPRKEKEKEKKNVHSHEQDNSQGQDKSQQEEKNVHSQDIER